MTLFDDPRERHAFVVGFGETACPWPSHIQPSSVADYEIGDEYWYYQAGRAAGVAYLLGIALLLYHHIAG